jgi:formiminotetrahydrofolate cyclodeaminase
MDDSADITTQNSTVDAWTRALAGTNGSPGGGAGAGVMLAIAASLMAMVAGYSERGGDSGDSSGSGDRSGSGGGGGAGDGGEGAGDGGDGAGDGGDGAGDGDLAELHARARALRETALRLADEDSAASSAFGAAYHLKKGPARDAAVRAASVDAARASSVLGGYAAGAVDDLAWLAFNGNPALIADVVVALGALRAAITGARTNVSFDLAAVTRAGQSAEQVRSAHPEVWESVRRFDEVRDRIDEVMAAVDDRAAPTDHE